MIYGHVITDNQTSNLRFYHCMLYTHAIAEQIIKRPPSSILLHGLVTCRYRSYYEVPALIFICRCSSFVRIVFVAAPEADGRYAEACWKLAGRVGLTYTLSVVNKPNGSATNKTPQ